MELLIYRKLKYHNSRDVKVITPAKNMKVFVYGGICGPEMKTKCKSCYGIIHSLLHQLQQAQVAYSSLVKLASVKTVSLGNKT